jgi:hypothetical protein
MYESFISLFFGRSKSNKRSSRFRPVLIYPNPAKNSQVFSIHGNLTFLRWTGSTGDDLSWSIFGMYRWFSCLGLGSPTYLLRYPASYEWERRLGDMDDTIDTRPTVRLRLRRISILVYIYRSIVNSPTVNYSALWRSCWSVRPAVLHRHGLSAPKDPLLRD